MKETLGQLNIVQESVFTATEVTVKGSFNIRDETPGLKSNLS